MCKKNGGYFWNYSPKKFLKTTKTPPEKCISNTKTATKKCIVTTQTATKKCNQKYKCLCVRALQ